MEAGFTIIEMMIVVAIVAIAAAFAVPSWQRMNDNIRLRAAARGAAQTFGYAREQSIRTERRHLVFFQLGPAVDGCGNALPAPLLVLDDANGDCCIDAGEPSWTPEEIAQPAVQATAFWGVTNAAAPVPEDSGRGAFASGSTFTTPLGAATSVVGFRPDGIPIAMGAGCAPAPQQLGSGGGGIYFTNGRAGLNAAERRDLAVVLSPLGTTKVYQWNAAAGVWTQ